MNNEFETKAWHNIEVEAVTIAVSILALNRIIVCTENGVYMK